MIKTIDNQTSSSTTTTRARRPMGLPRRKLPIPHMPGFVGRWMNDTVGRLNAATEGGYEFVPAKEFPELSNSDVSPVNSDVGSRISRIGGVNADGTPMRVYLMRIRKEYYTEDQKAKDVAIDETAAQIHRGVHNEQAGDKRYVKHITESVA